MRNIVLQCLGFVVLMIALAASAVAWLPALAWLPGLQARQDGLEMHFALLPTSDKAACEVSLDKAKQVLGKSCPQCVVQASCTRGVRTAHRALLAGDLSGLAASGFQAAVLSKGTVVGFNSPRPGEALQACEVSAKQSRELAAASQARCLSALQ